METIFVRPAPGRRVRFPDHPERVLLEAGERVSPGAYWLRRLAQGDVVQVRDAAGHAREGRAPKTREAKAEE